MLCRRRRGLNAVQASERQSSVRKGEVLADGNLKDGSGWLGRTDAYVALMRLGKSFYESQATTRTDGETIWVKHPARP